MPLITRCNLEAPDDIYARLMAAHAGCTASRSEQINARLILILMNHIGDERVLTEAIEEAKRR